MTAVTSDVRSGFASRVARARSVTAERSYGLGVVRSTVAVVSLGALWLVLFGTVLSGIENARTQRTLYAKFREELASATAPVKGPIAVGAPVALLSVPSIHLHNVVVVEGSTSSELKSGPGHRRDTVLPGQAGWSIVEGRALLFGGPFRDVPELHAGSLVSVVTGQGAATYKVTAIRHAGDAVQAPAAGTGRLTLVTAEGSRWSPSRTVYVDAQLDAPVTASTPNGSASADFPMASDTSALMPLVLWLEALLAASLGSVWATKKWGGRQAWLVGGVAIVAALWGATESAASLLPNLL